MKIFTKAAALIMASVLMFSTVGLLTGCQNSVDDGIHVPSKSTWYDTVKFDLKSPYDDIDLTYGMMHTPVYIEDSLYVLVTGEKRFDYSLAMSDPGFNYNDYLINSVLKYDMKGNLVEEINLDSIDGLSDFQISSVSEYKGKLKLNALATDKNSWATDNYCIIINPKSGKIESCDPCNLGDIWSSNLAGIYTVGDYDVNVMNIVGLGADNYNLVITSGTEVVNTIDVAKTTGINFWDINQIVAIDDDTLVMKCYSDDGNMTGTLKVSSGEFSISRDGMKDLGEYRFTTDQKGKAYAVNSEGIWQLNSDMDVEPLLAFADTYINANSACNGQVAYSNDDMTILFAEDPGLSVTLTTYSVFLISKAKSNPNAGKTILDVYVMSDSLSYSEAESIVQFNSTNPDYFAAVRYADFEPSIDVFDENKKMNNISNQLMIDIMSGDGPDVILDGAAIQELNNPEYFVDLNKFINGANGIDKSKYFSKIIDSAASSDGALYQMPVSYSIGGILAYKSDVEDGRVGFTYDEYIKFVDLVCNGNNPIQFNQSVFLADCIARGYVDYMADGKVNFNTPEFKAIAEYAKDNIFEKFESEDEEDYYMLVDYKDPIADGPIDVMFTDSESFVYQVCGIHEPFGMYGYPGVTGNDGPTAYIDSSVAIAATADEEAQNAAWDFIKIMLSEDVQKKEQTGNPVNIAAYTYNAQSAVNLMNAQYDSYLKVGMDEDELAMDGIYRTDEEIVDYLVEIANSVTSVNSIDSSVKVIIHEEMAPYFVGQKDIDSVLVIINDRAQTVFDERKSK